MEPLPALPDDVLLEVFAHLDTPDLLRARGVCRRWLDLALHPELWASRDVSWRSPHAKAVLLRAPCLRVLDLQMVDPQHDDDALPLVRASRCAARELRLGVAEYEEDWLRQVLEAQAALGRLRKLELFLHKTHFRDIAEHEAWLRSVMTLVDRAGLEALDMENEQMDPLPAWTRGSGEPRATRLKQLVFQQYDADPLLLSLVAAHADTLEHVEVRGASVEACSEHFMVQLARCPRLRWLRVELSGALAALDLCRLTHLHLDLYPRQPNDYSDEDGDYNFLVDDFDDVQEFVSELAPVFRSAARLEELTLDDVGSWNSLAPDVYWLLAGELVEAIATSGRSALRELRFKAYLKGRFVEDEWQCLREEPMPPLPHLPHLHTLELPCALQAGALAAVRSCAPGLRLLVIGDPLCTGREPCAMRWVRALLAEHPGLHVRARGTRQSSPRPRPRRCHQQEQAELCAAEGHPALGDSSQLACAFFAHPEEQPCGLHGPVGAGGQWVRLL